MVIGLVVAVIVIAGGIFLLTGGDDDGDDQADPEPPPSEPEDDEGETDDLPVEPTETGPDNSTEILAAANAAYTAFAEADCPTLDRLMMPGAQPPADCNMVANSLGLELEFTDVELVSQTEDEAFVDHILHLTDDFGTDALPGTTRLVNQDGEWLVADFNGTGSGGGSSGPPPDAPALGEPTPPPTGSDSSFHDELAQTCHDGNMFDCDWLFESAVGIWLPESQPHQDYAAVCGGRIDEPANGRCVEWYGSSL